MSTNKHRTDIDLVQAVASPSILLPNPGAPSTVEVSAESSSGATFVLSIDWEMTTRGAGIPPARDGDVYRVTLVDENGNTVVNLNEMVTYTASRPSGPDCDPECHRAVIDKRR